MPLTSLKSPLIDMYYLATLPQRKKLASEREEKRLVPIVVLFYHRVANSPTNSWTISEEAFQNQMKWLEENYDLITLTEAQKRISSETNTTPAACVTFDDGYADNCDTAIPWLTERHIPVTYFVTTRNIQTGDPFVHDVKSGCPLAPNTVEQIQEMANHGIEIGAHTRTHSDLGLIKSERRLHDEIVGSKRDLEDILGKPVNYFAFPFGMPSNMSQAAFSTAFQAGFWGVCSAYGDYNIPGDDSFHIRRIHGDPQWSRFRNWLTIDPRKLKHRDSFCPGDYRNHF